MLCQQWQMPGFYEKAAGQVINIGSDEVRFDQGMPAA